MSLTGHGGPCDGHTLARRLRHDVVPTVRCEAHGTEYVQDDQGQYVPIVSAPK